MELSDDRKTEDFLRLYNQEQRRIHAYIRTLMFSPEEAEDVFQETCIALWRSFDQFEPGTDFGAWARTTARYRVLAHARKRGTDKHVFASETVERLAEEIEDMPGELAARSAKLEGCVGKLPDADRQLLASRYLEGKPASELAEEFKRPLSTLYKSLRRIRRALLQCVELSLKQEEHSL
ncbi:sigma-70 family RNA polymerase sigma factor [Aeoliella sp. ICT_H6.2]|uniref:Sigma-70 family RNA polymerase sigma factor n=1 Tax=Aeoliella straminimaris TaxID=2954799 RepID=A0A9X2FAN6_9BACT|nr:sigma-70 family RNA polymerase sigma factor [Aeoliella straminimaris]MCO6044662.1 sigma-70 family RNA polymerase sigma factor [Aeoliella straminimaris]